jgi:hypothetical protein
MLATAARAQEGLIRLETYTLVTSIWIAGWLYGGHWQEETREQSSGKVDRNCIVPPCGCRQSAV